MSPVGTSTVTTAWVPPPAITGFSGTAIEGESYIQLDWDVSTLSTTDFNRYTLYRRELGSEIWVVLANITVQGTLIYKDYTAGQTIQYEYMVTQFKNIPGDDPLESDDSDVVTALLSTDGWFVITIFGPGNYDTLELVVTDDNHTSVVQQEIFEPLAHNRKRIVRGLTLGDEGSFTAWFDTGEARAAKVYLETLAQTTGPHIFKSPFGDVWYAEFDAPGFKYTRGGHLQVTMGWVEVG